MNKMLLPRLILTAFLLTILIFAGACEPVPDVKDVNEETASIEGSRGLFYQVEGGKNELYLLGSIHYGIEDMYPLHNSIYEAFAQADVLGLEIDLNAISEKELREEVARKAFLEGNTVMTDIVPDELFEELYSILEGYGVEREMLKRLQPWFAAFEISAMTIREAGYNPEYGVENYLLEKAEAKGMEVIGLETIARQFAPFAKLSAESQALYLEQSLEEYEDAEDELENLFQDWVEGNAGAYTDIRQELIEEAKTESLREFQIAFNDGRDEYMAGEIAELLQDDTGNTYFITVGSLHLVGKNSIVDRLEEKGYQVINMYN